MYLDSEIQKRNSMLDTNFKLVEKDITAFNDKIQQVENDFQVNFLNLKFFKKKFILSFSLTILSQISNLWKIFKFLMKNLELRKKKVSMTIRFFKNKHKVYHFFFTNKNNKFMNNFHINYNLEYEH